MMKIGTSLKIEVNEEEIEEQSYFSKVIEENQAILFIDYPINEKTRKTVFFTEGTTITATYVEDEAVYRFISKVVFRKKNPLPVLAIEKPKKDEIERLQRRDYVRIDTDVDIAVHSPDNSFSPFTTVTVDLSGGGVSFIIPKHVNLTEGEHVAITIVLVMETGKYHYIHATCNIIRIKRADGGITIGSCQFLSLVKSDQEMIIQYCFEKQREIRRKELS